MEFMENFRRLVLFNTIENHPDKNGLTYYDLTQIDPDIPHSRIYRGMKKLTELGYLHEKEVKREDEQELGRPKKYYTLSETGKQHLEDLKKKIRGLAMKLSENLAYDKITEFDFRDLPKPKFHDLESILKSKVSNEEKLQELTDREDHFKSMLQKISKLKRQLEEQQS
jgi:DNA-binding PadR family transcriptional regulator